ncbi:hypothetical protein SNEBB_003384 [Seison nebaliae]|nr:hypothetical protein SNEBB_003384 [Seison nebaliae]
MFSMKTNKIQIKNLFYLKRLNSTTINYNELTSDNVRDLKNLSSISISDGDELISYNTDWMNLYKGKSHLLLKPKTTIEVSKILRYCNERKLPVCLQGGKTGLVGGSIPVNNEIIVNMSLMDKIRSWNRHMGILTAEAGCILENVESYLKERKFMPPIDLGSRGSCQLGGLINTNAGGLRYIRYGSLLGNCLGLEYVTSDGTIYDNLQSDIRKNNTGYPLSSLLVGSEGTLACVTAVSLLCTSQMNSRIVLLIPVHKFDHILHIFTLARENFGEILSAFEFLDSTTIRTVKRNNQNNKLRRLMNELLDNPKNQFYIMMETMGSNEEHDLEKIEKFSSILIDKNLTDHQMMVGDTETKLRELWSIREDVALAAAAVARELKTNVYKYDISLPQKKMEELANRIRQQFSTQIHSLLAYGHIGDSNLHMNIIGRHDRNKEQFQKLKNSLDSFIFTYLFQMKGSISAEHGLGFAKKNWLSQQKSKESINLMRKLKKVYDPNHILNPFKYFPD